MLATQYWAGEILERSGANSINHLPIRLQELGDSRDPAYKTKSKYWYNKFNGQRVRNDQEINRVDFLLPGTVRVIYHPIWQLLDIPKIEPFELLPLVERLPSEYQQLLLNRDKTALSPKPLHTVKPNSNLDALSSVLISHLFFKNKQRVYEDNLYDMSTLKLLVRMFYRKGSKDVKRGFKLLKKVTPLFSDNKCMNYTPPFGLPRKESTKLDISVNSFPNYLSNVKSLSSFEDVLSIYAILADYAKLKLPNHINSLNEQTFLSHVSNLTLHELTWQLFKTDETNLQNLTDSDALKVTLRRMS
jgi:hypothetical protein